MALIKCPECGKEISDKGVACPNCGCPVSCAADAPQRSEEGAILKNEVSNDDNALSLKKKKKSNKKLFIIGGAVLVLIIVACFIFSTILNPKITASNVGINAFYEPALGIGVRLGQEKTDVDKLLGTSIRSDEAYEYDSYIHIYYENGKIKEMSITDPESRWITKGGINIGTTVDKLTGIMGEPRQIANEDMWYYQNGDYVIGFRINSYDRVNAIKIIELKGKQLYTQEEYDAAQSKK